MSPLLRDKRLWLIIITIFTLIVLINISSKNNEDIMIFKPVITAIQPIQKAFFTGSRETAEFFKTIMQLNKIKEENKFLKNKVSSLENSAVMIKELQLENQRLKEMLNFKEQSFYYGMEGAKVVGRNPSNWFETILIDKGKQNGIDINMAVVTNKGLVGRVIETGSRWSKVLLIIDQKSSVSAMIQRTRDNGIIKGQIEPENKGYCQMVYLPIDSNVLPGDLVISSGLGGIFPKGLIIGEVERIEQQENELLKIATIKPAVDFQRLEEVFIIVKKPDNELLTEEEN
ncbi:MAG TPA: rod shape-determining protein MreC [Thermoanaerobacterales bacterium]|nr:rod shape-determining protein MreC [Thermoanaerobacterales bacterium]